MKGFAENDCIVIIKEIDIEKDSHIVDDEVSVLKVGWEGTVLVDPIEDSLFVEVFNEKHETVFTGTIDSENVKHMEVR